LKTWNGYGTQPALYTVWFKIIFDEFYHFLKNTKPFVPK
jgi:isopentenyl-diphosphate delta-isomerase